MAKNLPIVRACGSCQACCSAIRVETDPEDKHQIHKRSHQRCAHQAKRGCGIYEERPECCRVFTCMWLHGAMDERDRPDRLGVVIEPVHPLMPDAVIASEVWPGAMKGKRARRILSAYADKVGRAIVMRFDREPMEIVGRAGVRA